MVRWALLRVSDVMTLPHLSLVKLGWILIGSTPFIVLAEITATHIDALIAAIPPTLSVCIGFWLLMRGQQKLHMTVNSRLTQLLKLTKKNAHAAGVKEQKDKDARK